MPYSNGEFETRMFLSGDLGFVEKNELPRLRTEIGDVEKMFKGPIQSLYKNT